MAKLQLLSKWPSGLLIREHHNPWAMFWAGWFWSAIVASNLTLWLTAYWRDPRVAVVVALFAAVLPSFVALIGLRKSN